MSKQGSKSSFAQTIVSMMNLSQNFFFFLSSLLHTVDLTELGLL